MAERDPQQAAPQPHRDHIVLGMAAGAGGFFMLSVMVVFAKLLSENHSVLEIGFYRNLIAVMPFLFMVFVLGRREIVVIRRKPFAIFSRAVLGALSLVTTFAAFAVMPLADTSALLFTSSLFLPVLGVIFLGEKVGPYRWAAVVAGFIGVLVMVRPTGAVNFTGVALALGAAFMHANLQVILRHLRDEDPETVTFYFMVIGVVVLAIPLPFVAVRPTIGEIPLLLGVGLSGALGQWLLSLAFGRAPAAVVTVFNYTSIIWATLFGWLIFGDWPLPAVFAGAAIVIAANLFMVWRESRLGRVRGDRVRARL